MYYTNLPIDIGQEYRQKSIHNFKWLLDKVNAIDETIDKHKNSSRYAHDAKNLLFENGSVHVELNYLRKLIINLVLGHNGDGIQELRDSRTAIDSTNFPLLSDRLKYDLQVIDRRIDNEVDKIMETFSYYINIKSVGANGNGKTDNTNLFSEFKPKQVYFVPEGTYLTREFPEGLFFGYGDLKIKNEIVPLDNKTPQLVNVDYNTKNKERYYSWVAGQQAGRNQTKESYSNTGVGYAVLRDNTKGRRLTAFGKGAMSKMLESYSNDAFGSDALGQGKFGQRNTAVGANALKWGGINDAIETLHDFWLEKGSKNFINSYFLPRWSSVWQHLGTEYHPNTDLYSYKDEDYINNVGIGRNSLLHMMKGIGNVAVGYNSQAHTVKGDENTSIGNRSLRDNLLGYRNTALGSYSSVNNITGQDNVAIGANNLQQTLHASNNTAVGYGAMHFFKDDKNKNTDDTYTYGYRNTAIGTQAMQDGKNSSYSVMVGSYAGRYVEGNHNIGIGSLAMPKATTAQENVGVGSNVLREIIKGKNNTAIGYTSGPVGDYNNTTSIGSNSHALGNNQVQLGSADATVYAHKEIQQRSDRRDKNSIRRYATWFRLC
ncbi:hypothetical protein ACVDHH_01410 [Staphylococcus saprophyticus]